MNKIKLPGSDKTKKIILLILVAIAMICIGKVAAENRNEKIRIEEERIEEERQEAERQRIEEEERQRKEKEELLYNEVFEIFHDGNYLETIEKANKIISEFPDSYKLYSIRGIAKAYNGDFEDGMKDIDKALEIEPNYGYGRFNKALNYELYKKLDDAIIWYDKALEIEKYIWSYYGKASVYGRYGNVKDAVKNLKLAIDEAADEETVKRIKEEARNEADFDPISGESQFKELIQ